MSGFNCANCHALPTGTNTGILRPIFAGGITQNFKVAQLRNMYEKTGFDILGDSHRGFGFLHDGSFDTLDTVIGQLGSGRGIQHIGIRGTLDEDASIRQRLQQYGIN